MTDTVKKTLRDSAAMRWTALLLLALAMFCAYIFMDILSPIKDLMESTRGWDSKAFGTMQGSEVFLNVFVFFLIFAGIILDKMGVRFTAVLSGAVMFIGGLIKWYAVHRRGLHRRCPPVLPEHAGLREAGGHRIHDLRLRLRNGGHYGEPRYRQVVQGPGDGPRHGL